MIGSVHGSNLWQTTYSFSPSSAGINLLNNGRRVKAMAVNHPSVGYSWDYWYRVLEKFFLH